MRVLWLYVQPLLAVFDVCGPSAFLDLCLRLLDLHCTGHLLAWAFDFASHDPTTFHDLVTAAPPVSRAASDSAPTLSSLVSHVNSQAAFYECFPGHGRVGRMRLATGQGDER